jgi:hypothetical protein
MISFKGTHFPKDVILAKANAFPDTLEKLFVENDFTTTQKKDIFPDKTDQEFGVNLGEGPYDSYSPVEY